MVRIFDIQLINESSHGYCSKWLALNESMHERKSPLSHLATVFELYSNNDVVNELPDIDNAAKLAQDFNLTI